MKLETILDRMIDQATMEDASADYTILLGVAPLTDTHWAEGRKAHRWFPVAQTRLVPNYLVVLAPSPGNGNQLFELHGRIDDGEVTRHTVVHDIETGIHQDAVKW